MTKVATIAEGTRLLQTQSGKDRERFSRLYGVFMELDPTTQEMKLVQRNFPSQKIMNTWMEQTGWTKPERAGRFVIYRGSPLAGLKVSQERLLVQTVEQEAVAAIIIPSQGRKPAAPKPVVPVAAEADAADVSDVSTVDLDVEIGDDGIVRI